MRSINLNNRSRSDNGVRNRAMAHESLQRPCIDSTGRQGVASGVPQHVSMDREWQLSGHAKPLYQLLCAIDGQRSLSLGQEHEVAWGCSRRSARNSRSSSPCKP